MFKKNHPTAGARPGTLLIRSDALPTRVRLLRYDRRRAVEQQLNNIDELRPPVEDEEVTWIDVQGFADIDLLQLLAQRFRIHPLAMEDVVNTPQRPKVESYGDQLLIIARHVPPEADENQPPGQLTLILGPNYVITFDERHGECLEPVRQRIALPSSRLRRNGPDYLAYAILDTLVDSLYPHLAGYGERLEQLEELVVSHPHPELLRHINRLKNRLVQLRRSVWPQRDAIRTLSMDDTGLLGETARTFLRDTHDHCAQIADVVEMYRDTATELLNLYLSTVAHRSNEVMKVLTIMSSIFVPMTFIAGVYGMNFQHMPELGFAWSYPAILACMLGSAAGMLWFFARKGWITIQRLPELSDLPIGGAASSQVESSGAAREQMRILEHDSANFEELGPSSPEHEAGQAPRTRPRARHAA